MDCYNLFRQKKYNPTSKTMLFRDSKDRLCCAKVINLETISQGFCANLNKVRRESTTGSWRQIQNTQISIPGISRVQVLTDKQVVMTYPSDDQKNHIIAFIAGTYTLNQIKELAESLLC